MRTPSSVQLSSSSLCVEPEGDYKQGLQDLAPKASVIPSAP